MKTIIIGILAFGLFAFKNEKSNSTTKKRTAMEILKTPKTAAEQATVIKVLETLFAETDNRNWDVVTGLMSDSVYIDYSGLGGAPGFSTPQAIVNGWQKLLPGFDRTVHHLHNFTVAVAGNRATGNFEGIATHYLANEEWTVFAGYDTEFIKKEGQWKLARIDLSLYGQYGNLGLPQKAMEAVANGTISDFTEVDASKTKPLEAFFMALEKGNLENVLATMAPNAVQKMPLSPENFPKTLNGIAELKKQYTSVMAYTQKYEREYFATQNPNVVLVKYKGTITTTEGKPYNNAYVGIFTLDNKGKIVTFIEYFNPKILLASWPGLQPATYSMHEAGARTDSGVTMETVQFFSNGMQLKGHLFLPPNFNADEKYPTALVTGSWTSVKEQMPDEYASIMALEGFITLTFDFTGFGESEGQPRFVEDYRLKIADIKAAVDYLEGHSNVDMENLTGLGVCASSGYMAHATAKDRRITKLVLVAPWLHDADIAKHIYDMRPGGTEGLLASAKAAKEKYATTGIMDYVLAASELDPLSAMYVPENAFDYYLNPAKAAGPKYDNLFAVSSWEPWLTFDGISAGKEITQPVFIVHSESGALPQGTKAFYGHLKGKKDIKWHNEFNQQQLYFDKNAVNTVMSEVVTYLK
ncbi:nuclear transport factor 2 family protein [Maribacter sp. 2-571]|uniref:nuclear transport factor 2 family protein n=1 Tax=Maribacter sp. 2-571 TaxID=3417569 RepID=UPI003D32EB21